MFSTSKRSIVFHVGTGKTGTTAIQHFLTTHSSHLEFHGFRYATSCLHNYNHHALCANYLQRENTLSSFDNTCHKLINELRQYRQHFIVSSEYFLGNRASEFADLRDCLRHFGELHAVVYFRRQDTFVESWWNQVVKSGELDINIYQLYKRLRRSGLLDYEPLAQKLTYLCEPKHIHVRSFDAAKESAGGVVKDFFSFLGIASTIKDDSYPAPTLTNVSLSANCIKLLRLIHARLGKLHAEYFMQRQPDWFPLLGSSSVFTPSERAMIIHAHAKGNRALVKRFCPEVEEFFNPLRIEDLDESPHKADDKSLEDYFAMAVDHLNN